MKKLHFKNIAICSLTALICACNGFFDKDNTPTPTTLVNFKETAHPHMIWETSVNSGIGADYLKLAPAISNTKIFTADKNGYVTASDKSNGKTLWKTSTDLLLSAGPAYDQERVFVGSRDAHVIALSALDGKSLWDVAVSTEVLSPPNAHDGLVIIKTIDGKLTALSALDGHAVWQHKEVEPNFILRGGSAPQIIDNNIIVGFANGNLMKLTLDSGEIAWQEAVATPTGTFAIQRMIDIDADPYVFGNKIYVATYQGRISALDFHTGKSFWDHDISSFTGLSADHERVFVSDAKSDLWAFDAANGTLAWRQADLAARNISGPALMGDTIVVGDEEGYLHWLSKQDGHFLARIHLGGSGILAAPLVDNNVLYVLTKDGHLAAFTLS